MALSRIHFNIPFTTSPDSVPHDGVSLDRECMTYSVGFRAPTQRQLVASVAEEAQARLGGEGCVGAWMRGCVGAWVCPWDVGRVFFKKKNVIPMHIRVLPSCSSFYTDRALQLQADCGEIAPESIQAMRRLVQEALAPVMDDEAALTLLLGKQLTAPRRQLLGDEDFPLRPLWGEEESGWASARHVVGELRWVCRCRSY